MIFKCEPVAERDDHGVLQATGLRWTEARTLTENVILWAAIRVVTVSFALILIGVLGVFAGQPLPQLIGLGGLVLCGLAWGCIWLGCRIPGRSRELSFWRDGAMELPLAIAVNSRAERIGGHHSEIASIEAEQVVFPKGDSNELYTHGVRVVKRDGRVIHVARHLEPDDAMMVAVQLMQALALLRDDVANARTSVARRRSPRQARELVID